MKIPIWRVYVHIPLSDTYDIHLLEKCWKDRHPWHQTELPGFTISPRTKMTGKHRPPDMFRQPYLLYSAFLPGFWQLPCVQRLGIPPSGVAKDLSISGCDVNIEQMVDVTMKSICYPWKPAVFFLHLGEKPCNDPMNVFPRSALNPPSESPSWLSRGVSRDKNTKKTPMTGNI